KVLHEMAGRTLVGHTLAAAAPLGADTTLVVVGAGRDAVSAHLADIAPHAVPVVQAEQRGTGHAARVALEAAPDVDGTVLVLPGDTPLLRTETLRRLVEEHQSSGAVATGLTVGALVTDATETAGVNDRVQLAAAHRAYNERLLADWMRAGVTVVDPATTWVDA